MQVTILDDWAQTIPTLPCYPMTSGHRVTIWNDHTKDLDALAARLADTEALVLIRERTPIPGALIARLPKLRLISQHSVYPHIDVDACTRHGVVVCSNASPARTPSYSTAELTWTLIGMATRDVARQMASLRAGRWQTGVGRGLRGKTLGVFGYGRLGGVIAGYGRAFGMKVVVWARPASLEKARADGYATAVNQASFFEQCDVISLHLRLVEATRGIVTATDLARMHPHSVIVNTSRHGLFAPGALEAALRAGRPGMAAIDVFDEEPVTDPAHPLLALDNLIATPHLGYVEFDQLEVQFREIFEQINAYAAGQPINVVNPAALAVQTTRRP